MDPTRSSTRHRLPPQSSALSGPAKEMVTVFSRFGPTPDRNRLPGLKHHVIAEYVGNALRVFRLRAFLPNANRCYSMQCWGANTLIIIGDLLIQAAAMRCIELQG